MNLDFKMLIWDQKMGSKLRKFLGTSLDLDYFIEKSRNPSQKWKLRASLCLRKHT